VKKIQPLLVLFFALLFFVLAGWSMVELRSIERSVNVLGARTGHKRIIYHFAVLIPSREYDPFFLRAYNGMKRIADAETAALQVFEYQRGAGPGSVEPLLRIIKNTSPNGLIVSIPYDPLYEEIINAIAEKHIPVVTLENDFASSTRNAYVGTNTFEMGRLAGQAAGRVFPRDAEIGVLLAGEGNSRPGRNSGFIQGLRQSIRDFAPMNIGLIRSFGDTNAAGEEFIREILVSHTDISAVIFTGPREAEGAAQALIEFGRVGTPLIIAVDDNPEIRLLMEMGIISATIVRRPELAGEAAVKALIALARNERTNAYVDPGVSILWAEDLTGPRL
jgi:ribose transport system substrate-binding protein